MSYMSEKITALTDGDFSLKSSVSHSIETTRLISRLGEFGIRITDGLSYEGMGFIEKSLVRGVREM